MTPDEIRKLVLPTDYQHGLGLDQESCEKLVAVLRACADVVEAAREQGGVVGGSPLQVALAKLEAL